MARTHKVWVEVKETDLKTGEVTVVEKIVSLPITEEGVIDVTSVPSIVRDCEKYIEIGDLIDQLTAKKDSHKGRLIGLLDITKATHIVFGDEELGIQRVESTRNSFS